MEGNCLETVLMQRSAVKSQMAANRAALQFATRRARYERAREAQVWQLSPQEEQVAIIIYMDSGYAIAPAVEYLQQLGRRKGWPQKASEMLGSLAEDMFLAVEPTRLAELSDQGDPAAPAAMRVACAFLAEWGLFRWVDDANRRKGVAPSTESLLQELERRRLQLPEAFRFPSRGVSSENKARVWALQWRKRWGAHHGKVRVREDIPAAEMRAKVLVLVFSLIARHGALFRGCFLAPFLGVSRGGSGLRVVERKQLSMCYAVRKGAPFWPGCGP